MTTFRRLAAASTVATFLLITIGGLVRATKSGLGCGTNWPDCPGAVTDALIIEFSHRAAAGIVIGLIGALAFIGMRRHRDSPHLMWAAVGAFGLVLAQAVLGAIVVWLELEAESVVLHFATALALLALLAYIVIASRSPQRDELPEEAGTPSTVARLSAMAAGAVLLALLVGSYVTGTGAGNVFPDWPLMDGRVIPDLEIELQAVHFLHRVLVVVAAVFVGALVIGAERDPRAGPVQLRLARAAAGLFAVEVVVGAANVWSDLNSFFVTTHLALGAGIWLALVALTLTSHPFFATAGTRPSIPRSRAALESP